MGNIRDIAKLAKVSVTTVSRVLNNHPYVSAEKKEAVIKAIDDLNYHKNMNAVHLSKGKTNIIGVVLPFINHPYFSSILEGIALEAQLQHYKIMIIQTNYKQEKEKEALELLRQKQLDALIITSRSLPLENYSLFKEYGKIIMCMNAMDNDFSSVFINHFEAFHIGLTHLTESGHRKIGYAVGRRVGTNSHARYIAYKEFLSQIEEKPREEWIFSGCLTIEDGKRIAREWNQLEEKPTALILTNDLVAAGCILECRKLGISIPGELAIIGFENHEISDLLDITTIELPLGLMGRNAFNQILQSNKVQQIEIPYRLIKRKTV
ncbi:LacI family DNA-binding transcriptional regulator [Neobacillus terrae]|uniref:LacI family DNA-binding transcriptional regulator n=1 Tax=Neobacillus terrae TaxID=3034837 RepID=UPI00140CBF1E|nr:LacI family DNA-binding transcriptional regulator [Neobacillus terrae]NHM31567.1 LacI family DNA-binding transcriptional regulator [Neobacillus terrae]